MSLARLAARLKRGRLPSLFLVTDPARSCDLVGAMRRLPRGAGVIFRHYDAPDREAMARALRRIARERGLVFLVGGDPRLAARVGADGFHAPEALAHRIAFARRLLPRGLITMAAHGAAGMVSAARSNVNAALVSPVFATRSHPGGATLGVVRFAALASGSRLPLIALGGIDDRTARRLTGTRVGGFAAIGALSRQKPIENSVKMMSAPRSPA